MAKNESPATERVTVTTGGYSLHAAQRTKDGAFVPGKFIKWCEHVDDALYDFNKDSSCVAAEFVLRVSDGRTIAKKQRTSSMGFWASLWADRRLA